MLSAREALDIILSSVRTMPAETVDLRQTHGRVLAEQIIAAESVPPFDNSAMDGYALRSEDVGSVPRNLKIIGEVAAGKIFMGRVGPGEAVRIMTGGKIPPGADAVVQQEWTEALNEHQIKVLRPVTAGHNIRRAGEDIAEGQIVLEPGCELRAAQVGVLASLGRTSVTLYRTPKVAFLATGDELVEVGQPLEPGKIRNSNSYTLSGLLEELGAEAIDLGIARDDRTELKEKLLEGLHADALLTSGGVSVGKHDLVQNVMREIGVEIKFWKVNIKPGMPFLFGAFEDKPVFGLPGNPVSTMVTFLQFVRPALRKMMGVRNPEKSLRLRAELTEEISKRDAKRHFVRGTLETENGMLKVRPTGTQSSAVLTSLSRANCLIIIPEMTESLKKREMVEVELL